MNFHPSCIVICLDVVVFREQLKEDIFIWNLYSQNNYNWINTVIPFPVKPVCTIDQTEEDGEIVLTCTAEANPDAVAFEWRKNGNETVQETERPDRLVSLLRLEATQASFGSYHCVVNNSLGVGAPCEIDVQGEIVDMVFWGKNCSMAYAQILNIYLLPSWF